MKNITKSIIALFALVALSCSVEDVQDRPIIEGVDSPVLTAPASGAAYVLTPESAAAQAERFTWKSANYGGDVQVTYSVEMDIKGNAFATPQTIGSVNSENQVSVSVEALNNAALSLDATPFEVAEFEVRVKSAAGTLEMLSNVIQIVVTPYTTENPKLWLPGSYQGASGYGSDWTPSVAPTLSASGYGLVDFEGYVYFDAAGKFKMTAQPAWGPVDYGMGASAGTLDPTGGDISMNAAGYYLIKADTEKLTYTTTAISTWGIIGDATPGGWDSSTAMTYNKTTKLWTVTVNLTAKNFKFRANNGWDINLGDIKPAADGQSLEYGGADIPVATAGNYTITLDLSSPRDYKYTITKN